MFGTLNMYNTPPCGRVVHGKVVYILMIVKVLLLFLIQAMNYPTRANLTLFLGVSTW